MTEAVKCNKCSRTYTDKKSVDSAVAHVTEWRDLCARDGVEATGLMPCPDLDCSGEMVLTEGIELNKELHPDDLEDKDDEPIPQRANKET